MRSILGYVRRKIRKQVHKYWQRSLLLRLHVLDVRYPAFVWDYLTFSRRSRQKDRRFIVRWQDRLACLQDHTPTTAFDARHVYRLAWAERALAELRPSLHVDLSSDLSLSTLASAFIPVARFDTIPVRITLSGLECGVLQPARLPFADGSLSSLSCLGLVEHVGLGRYGEPLDPDGDLKVMNEILRVVKRGGTLLLAAPVGMARIRFNAYRVYAFRQISACFAGLRLKRFALIDDEGRYWANAEAPQADAQQDGYGCWWFIR